MHNNIGDTKVDIYITDISFTYDDLHLIGHGSIGKHVKEIHIKFNIEIANHLSSYSITIDNVKDVKPA